MRKMFFVSATVAAVCGCTVDKEPVVKPLPTSNVRYVNEGEVIAGKASAATMYDLKDSANELLKKLRADEDFMADYNEVKEADGGLKPVIKVGNIENRTTERIQGRLDSIHNTVVSSLNRTRLFVLKDVLATQNVVADYTENGNSGLEDGSLMEYTGTHRSPAFSLRGEFRKFEDEGGFHTYELRLYIINLRTGATVWDETQTKIKL